MYDVFIRRWYKDGPRDWMGKKTLVPGPGRKTYLAQGVTIEEARRLCDEYNSTHSPGRYSLKAEFKSR